MLSLTDNQAFDKHKAQKGVQQQQPSEEHEPVVLKATERGGRGENEDPVPRRPNSVLTRGNKMLPFVIT